MASRGADSSRDYRDTRGGARYSAPRRDDRRDERRDRDRDRERDSYRGDRRDTRHRDDRERDRDRDYRRRDAPRERDSLRRRSRSPPPRRERSRDRYRDDRHYGREDRYNGRDGGRNEGRRNSNDYGRLKSGTPSADVRPVSRSSNASHMSREDKQREEEKEKKRAEEEKRQRLAQKTAAWKAKKLQTAAESPANLASPTTAPPTPGLGSTPPANEVKIKQEAPAKPAVEAKPPQTSGFRIDPATANQPAQFQHVAGSSKVPAVASKCSEPTLQSLLLTQSDRTNGQVSNTNGNIGRIGLKSKSARDEAAAEATKNGLLDDSEIVSTADKRSLRALPTLADIGDEASSPVDEENSPSGNVEDDDEALREQLEKRRQDLAIEGNQMEEVPAADASGEAMDVDDAAGADEEEVDPLDAFMADLDDTRPKRPAFAAEDRFEDDNEPQQTSVEAADLLALNKTKKKKKNEIPKVDHEKVEYAPFRKNFYIEPAEVTAMSREEVADLRLELDGIKVQDETLPRPVLKWAQMGLLQPTMDTFAKMKFTQPTPIQAQAIPIIESGRNLIGVAKTGSGKTLAFGIPMIRHIIDQPELKPSDGPIALILAPTRELVLQIVAELKPFMKASNLQITSAYGGTPITDHIATLKRGGNHVLCATTGRLIELLGANGGRVLNFKRITYVVLDEADRMYDMGFEPQVVKILETIRPDRQAIMFSATFPKSMAALARRALVDPAEVTIGGRSVVADTVEQVIKVVKPAEKLQELLGFVGNLFVKDENAQVLIFVERQETAEDLLNHFMKARYMDVNTIHGAKDQNDRSEAITMFKNRELAILIATSVAARGLDVPNLPMVINFDCPSHLEDYVHRCGRTGRAGNKGTAVTLIEIPGEERLAHYVNKALVQSGRKPLPELEKIAEEFRQKIKSGEVKVYTGFGGSGIDKLDERRAFAKRAEKRALRLEGAEVSDDEEELPDPKKAKTDVEPKDKKAAEPAYMKILTDEINVNKTERPAPANTNMTAREKALAAASRLNERLSKRNTVHHGQPIDNKGPDAGLFHATLPINDFPQDARWAVTNRANVVKILDSTGVSITTKGIFWAEGKEPKEDEEPKLYVLVEGDTENVVTTAISELKKLLVEGIQKANDKAMSTRGPTGRYKID
jgi:ATP-dependent RNA helicase DDX46/PRP5